EKLLHRRARVEASSAVPRRPPEGGGYLGEPSQSVVDAVLVLHVGEHREGAGAFPGRHAEVLALEGEEQGELFVAEIALQIVEDGRAEGEMRQRGQKVGQKRGERLGEISLESGQEPAKARLLLLQE